MVNDGFVCIEHDSAASVHTKPITQSIVKQSAMFTMADMLSMCSVALNYLLKMPTLL